VIRALTILMLTLVIPGVANGADREREARELETMLIAPCCFSQQVSVHHSDAADEVRRDIRQRLAAGETRDVILKVYVQQYGKRILAVPPSEGFDSLLHFLPPFGLIFSAGLTMALVRRFARRGSFGSVPTAADAPPLVDEAEREYGESLDDQLRDLD
jgi:cytochrome c-type biogenesis protein CcmH/NrfF